MDLVELPTQVIQLFDQVMLLFIEGFNFLFKVVFLIIIWKEIFVEKRILIECLLDLFLNLFANFHLLLILIIKFLNLLFDIEEGLFIIVDYVFIIHELWLSFSWLRTLLFIQPLLPVEESLFHFGYHVVSIFKWLYAFRLLVLDVVKEKFNFYSLESSLFLAYNLCESFTLELERIEIQGNGY